jgi:DNA-binding Xre family transcriptional regulator
MVRLRVKEIAEQKGYNMSSLARKADIGFSTVKRIFQDPYREVTTTTLEKLAKALEVPTADLIEDVEGRNETGQGRI